jgi:16S rRNA (guanine527-N7)-methyltransferase
LGEKAFSDTFDVSRETLDRLRLYEELLIRWQEKINLVAPSTIPDLWGRHFSDSAQIWSLATGNARHWVDLGSGAGFPALVVAALARESQPELQFTLIESDARKGVFLRTVIRELDLYATVLTARIEAAKPQRADIVSARALAPLDRLLGYAYPHLNASGVCIFHKGARAADELERAQMTWSFTTKQHVSKVDPESSVLILSGIQHA